MRPLTALLLGTLVVAATALAVPAAARPTARAAGPRVTKSRLAKSKAGPSSFFLGADPHVPLAVVANGRVRDAVSPQVRGKSCGNKRRWGTVGSQWHALDAWGQIVATKTATISDPFYEVTGCTELEVSPKVSADDSRVLVSIDSAWHPSPSVAWSPSGVEQRAFAALLTKEVPDTAVAKSNVPKQCAAVAERSRYFEVKGRGRFAIGTTNAGYVVAKQDGAAWTIAHVERSKVTTFGTLCYRPLAIFDMNDDGVAEIVLRGSEGVWWGDFVLGLSVDGTWRGVAASPGGSTA